MSIYTLYKKRTQFSPSGQAPRARMVLLFVLCLGQQNINNQCIRGEFYSVLPDQSDANGGGVNNAVYLALSRPLKAGSMSSKISRRRAL